MDQDQNNVQQTAENDISDGNASRLAQIKARAIEELLAIMPEADEFSNERRFDVYMSAIRSSNNAQSAENALNAALSIEDRSAQANALSELIDEIEYLELKSV